MERCCSGPFGCIFPSCRCALLALIVPADQRVSDRVYRQRDPILYAHFAHQLSNVSLHGALLDLQCLPDLAISASGHQEFKDLLFAVGKRHPTGWKDLARRGGDSIDEDRHYAAGSPNGSLIYDSNRLNELRRTGGFLHVSLGSGSERFKNGFVVGAGAGDDNAQVRAYRLEAGHYVENAVSTAG